MERLKRLRQFLNEVWSELKKTTWPPQREVMGTTMVVIVFVLICAAYLWVVDTGLSYVMNLIFRTFE